MDKQLPNSWELTLKANHKRNMRRKLEICIVALRLYAEGYKEDRVAKEALQVLEQMSDESLIKDNSLTEMIKSHLCKLPARNNFGERQFRILFHEANGSQSLDATVFPTFDRAKDWAYRQKAELIGRSSKFSIIEIL